MTILTRIAIRASKTNNNNVYNSNNEKDRRNNFQVLACSAIKTEHRELINSPELCEYRKGFLEHLYPSALAKSTFRIVVIQGSHVYTAYLQDQMKEDIHRDLLVDSGKKTHEEAELEAQKWATEQWEKRWSQFHIRLINALTKYHAITFTMRIYEHLAKQYVDVVTMDRLTLDTFSVAKREHNAGKSGTDIFKDMVGVCGYANVISFLADFTVHQLIMVIGYYMYVQKQQAKRATSDTDENAVYYGSLTLSLCKRSALLALSRAIGLVSASVGGAIGSALLPGWGTLAGTNFFDSISAALTEDLVSGAPA